MNFRYDLWDETDNYDYSQGMRLTQGFITFIDKKISELSREEENSERDSTTN